MASTFIAGFDGSDGARVAVRFAARLAGAVGADVVAVTASDDAPTDDSVDVDGVASRLVRAGSPAQVLIEAADELDADLIVVGRHDASGLERMKLGSTAERVIHGAPCPVAIVPPEPPAQDANTIAVAYDGREPAQAALEYAAALARSLSMRLDLIAVAEPIGDVKWEGHGTDSRVSSAIVDKADEAAEALRADLDVGVRTEVAAPGDAIVAACTDDVALLVAGSRAYGPVHATLVGSVSHHLAAHTRCPVIVVPRQVRRLPGVTSTAS